MTPTSLCPQPGWARSEDPQLSEAMETGFSGRQLPALGVDRGTSLSAISCGPPLPPCPLPCSWQTRCLGGNAPVTVMGYEGAGGSSHPTVPRMARAESSPHKLCPEGVLLSSCSWAPAQCAENHSCLSSQPPVRRTHSFSPWQAHSPLSTLSPRFYRICIRKLPDGAKWEIYYLRKL